MSPSTFYRQHGLQKVDFDFVDSEKSRQRHFVDCDASADEISRVSVYPPSPPAISNYKHAPGSFMWFWDRTTIEGRRWGMHATSLLYLPYNRGQKPGQVLVIYVGCEYGDRASWCSTYADLDCSVDHQREQCCSTCAQRTDQPSTPGGGSCPLGDGATFCSTMPAMDCYYYSDLCCETCPTHHTGIDGNEMCIVCLYLRLNNMVKTSTNTALLVM